MKRVAALLAVWLCVLPELGAQESDDGRAQGPYDPRGAPIATAPRLPVAAAPSMAYEPLRGLDSTHDLGIGHLRAELDAGSPADTECLRRVEVPVYADPGGEVSGWIAEGWWVPSGDPARPAPRLRTGPGTGHRRSFWLPGYEATELHPLEIRGDWMRVRVSSPPVYCADPPPSRGVFEEGWVRWRDAEIGPWLWWFTRGC